MGGYKWTDPEGSELMGRIFEDRLLPLVLSRGKPRRWDSAAEFPPGFAPMPGITLVDTDTGVFFDNVVLGDASISMDALSRMKELHFAKGALQAMKSAMLRALRGEDDSTGRRWTFSRTARKTTTAASTAAPSMGPAKTTTTVASIASRAELAESAGIPVGHVFTQVSMDRIFDELQTS